VRQRSSPPRQHPTLITALLLALAGIAGYLDAAGYSVFDGVFVANMTGNSVILGIAAVTGHVEKTAHALLALAGFLGGAALGTLVGEVSAPRSQWSPAVTRIVFAQGLVIAVLALAWAVTPDGHGAFGLIAVVIAGGAMGMQSAAAQKLAVPAVSTVVLTTTLTALVARMVVRLRTGYAAPGGLRQPHKGPGILFAVWGAYVSGAAIGAAVALLVPRALFAAPAALALLVALAAHRARGSPPQPAKSSS
jgi:uncharacterized membrane protein YoaK (UPF0700 family)